MVSSHLLSRCSYLQTEVRAFNCRSLLQRVPLFADAGTCSPPPAHTHFPPSPHCSQHLIPKTRSHYLLRGRYHSVSRQVAAIFAFGSRGCCPVRGRDSGGNVRVAADNRLQRALKLRNLQVFYQQGGGAYIHEEKAGQVKMFLSLAGNCRPCTSRCANACNHQHFQGGAILWGERRACFNETSVFASTIACIQMTHPVTHELCCNFSHALLPP